MPSDDKNSAKEGAAGFVTSSGNVFADLGLPDANERFVKAKLMHAIAREIRARRLTQSEAGEIVGLSQGDISNINNGRVGRFAQERLITVLRNLGIDVEIVVTPRGSDHLGTLTVRELERT